MQYVDYSYVDCIGQLGATFQGKKKKKKRIVTFLSLGGEVRHLW